MKQFRKHFLLLNFGIKPILISREQAPQLQNTGEQGSWEQVGLRREELDKIEPCWGRKILCLLLTWLIIN